MERNLHGGVGNIKLEVGGDGKVLGAHWASREAGEAGRELRVNPALPELRERRKLNNSTGLYIEHASCDPLLRIQEDYSSSLGVCEEEISVERKLGGNRKWVYLTIAEEVSERAPPGGLF